VIGRLLHFHYLRLAFILSHFMVVIAIFWPNTPGVEDNLNSNDTMIDTHILLFSHLVLVYILMHLRYFFEALVEHLF